MTLENNNTVTQREHPAFEDDYIAPHRHPSDVSDRLAFAFVKALRFVADRFFAGRYGHRAVVLETVAAVPGMVGGLLQHLKALRHIRPLPDRQTEVLHETRPGLRFQQPLAPLGEEHRQIQARQPVHRLLRRPETLRASGDGSFIGRGKGRPVSPTGPDNPNRVVGRSRESGGRDRTMRRIGWI